jgi:hypothetical protein
MTPLLQKRIIMMIIKISLHKLIIKTIKPQNPSSKIIKLNNYNNNLEISRLSSNSKLS